MPKNVLILSLSFVSWAVCMMSLVAEVMRAIQEANGIRARQVAFARGVLDTYDANFVVWCAAPPAVSLTTQSLLRAGDRRAEPACGLCVRPLGPS